MVVQGVRAVTVLAALLLFGCCVNHPRTTSETMCYDYNGTPEVKKVVNATMDEVCGLRLCRGKRDDAHVCFYNCPSESLPEFCK
jgi:hypothetical protein